MQLKDMLTLAISLWALFFSFCSLVVSGLSFYFSHIHKKANAILVLNSRLFGHVGDKQVRELEYTFCNSGNLELFVREINIFRGPSNLGPARHKSNFTSITCLGGDDAFTIKPKEIKVFTLQQDTQYEYAPEYDFDTNKFVIVCLDVVSAKGDRYQMVHDITELASSKVPADHDVWKTVLLGNSLV